MKRALVLILTAQMLLGIVYSLATPIFEASDELWHYPMVREIATNLRLPVQDPNVETRWAQEGSQPPLYYVLGAALTGWIDTADYEANAVLNPFAKIGVPLATDNRNMVAHPPSRGLLQGGTVLAVMLIRWLSVLMGTATAYLAYRLARSTYPKRPAVGLMAAAFVAFNPMVLFINASVNNDNLLMLLCALALWLLALDVESPEPGLRWRQTLSLGLVLGLAALTKVSGLVLLPVAALALTLEALRSRDWRAWLIRGLTLALVVTAISGWWYVRNLALYGELTGMERMVAVAGPRPPGMALLDLRGEGRSFWYSFWGVFGAFNVLAPGWFYVLTGGISLVAAAGLLLGLTRHAARRQPIARWRTHILLLSFLALTFAGLLRWTLMTMASQGRLMFSGIAPIALYLALGLLAWFPRRWHGWVSGGLAVGLAGVAAIIPVLSIGPAYRPAAPVAALPADAVALNARCGDQIVLAGYRLGQPAAIAGQPIDVTLYWTTTQPIGRDLQLSLNGYGYKGENIAKLDTWPGGGLRPTSTWEPGQIYADHSLLATQPESNTPTLVKLGISWATDLLDPARNQSIPCYVDGSQAGAIFLDAGSLLGPAVRPAAGPTLATLQHGIELLHSQAVLQDNRLMVDLTWTTEEPVPGDYTVFVHLFDRAGNKVAQGDAPPRNGQWPTSHWRPGEPISSTHVLELPPDLPSGVYTIGAGMYDPATGQRLFAYDAQGKEWRDWMIVLPPVTVP